MVVEQRNSAYFPKVYSGAACKIFAYDLLGSASAITINITCISKLNLILLVNYGLERDLLMLFTY